MAVNQKDSAEQWPHEPEAEPVAKPAAYKRRSIAIYIPHIYAGGAEISMLNLALGLDAAGMKVWIVVQQGGGNLVGRHGNIDIISLNVNKSAAALPGLMRFVRMHRPDVLLSALPHNNIVAAVARLLARRSTLLVVTEHAPVTVLIEQANKFRYRILNLLLPLIYPLADAAVAVSIGVREDLQSLFWHRSKKLHVIYNPVLPLDWQMLSNQPVDDPWFSDGASPVILSAGRLSVEKDFRSLIRAFSQVLRIRPTLRLAILGTGPEMAALQALIRDLGHGDSIRLLGYVANPYQYMRHAAIFVLPSRFEGFGNVLVEAMACGAPVISTDCPVGPREILKGGEFGGLVPVGDIDAMAAMILLTLDGPGDRESATQHALQFTVEAAVNNYLDLFDKLIDAK